MLKVGLPTGMQMIAISLAEIALLSMVNSYGFNVTAAYGAVNQVVAYVQFPAISIAITASILGAQAIGAGRADKPGAIARTGLLMSLVLTSALVEVPVAWFMSHRIGIDGIWIAYPVTFIAVLGLQTAYYRLVWKKKAIKRLI